MNKANYFALGAVVLTLISIFLPWVEVSVVYDNPDLKQSLIPETISGIAIGYGIIGFLIALGGAFLTIKKFRWTFIAGIINFIDGFGYLHGWFGAATRDSANYGDVTSQSSVIPKYGLYLFIISSAAFLLFTIKFIRQKRTVKVSASKPNLIKNLQAAYKNAASQVYKPSKIQKMTTESSEKPTVPVSTEIPETPVQPAETATEQPAEQPLVTPAEQTPVTPTVTPAEPVKAVVTEPAPVYNQAPQATYIPQPPVQEAKKSSTSKILLIVLAVLLLVGAGIFYTTFNSSKESQSKTEQSVNDEKARLQVIIDDVNQAVNEKRYDDALLKINSINWLYQPDANKGYVDQYNVQRENLRNTIEQMKLNDHLEQQNSATEKANAATSTQPAAQSADSIH